MPYEIGTTCAAEETRCIKNKFLWWKIPITERSFAVNIGSRHTLAISSGALKTIPQIKPLGCQDINGCRIAYLRITCLYLSWRPFSTPLRFSVEEWYNMDVCFFQAIQHQQSQLVLAWWRHTALFPLLCFHFLWDTSMSPVETRGM